MIVYERPSDELLEKLTRENPDWGIDDWAHWWGRWYNKQARKQKHPIPYPEDEQ